MKSSQEKSDLLSSMLRRDWTRLSQTRPSFHFPRRLTSTWEKGKREQMKAVRVNKHGGAEVLSYETIEKPKLIPGSLVIKNHAIGVNFIDTYHREGTIESNLRKID